MQTEWLLSRSVMESTVLLTAGLSFWEQFAAFLTHPIVVPILLSVAALGILIEAYTPGISFPGLLGFSALGLFYYGHFTMGTAGVPSIIFLIIGGILIVMELVLPSGIVGALGAAAILASVLTAGDSLLQMGISVLIAMVIALIGAVILVKLFGKQLKLFSRIILSDSTSTEGGYVSNVKRSELIGQTARTVTALRPSGTVLLGDERLDAVSDGGFIDRGKEVRILKMEGSWIVVRELEKEEEQ